MESVENIAKEWIDTPEEKARANALMIKTLDPNGGMRRQISRNVTQMYMVYIYTMIVLVILQSFNVGDVVGVKAAIGHLTDLFVPVTAAFTSIVGASFGVNYNNTNKGV